MALLIYSPACVKARITSPTMKAKLTDEHIAIAADNLASEQGWTGVIAKSPISWADPYQRQTLRLQGHHVADDQLHKLLAGRTALLIYDTEQGVVPS